MAEAYGIKLKKKGKDIESIKSVYLQKDVAKTYDKMRFNNPAGFQKHILESRFIANTIFFENARAVDIAGGTGRLSKVLAENDAKVTIFDQSPEMLGEAKNVLKGFNVKFKTGDAFKMPFKARSFDIVLMMRFLRHFSGKERKQLLEQAHKILDKKGLLIFDACNIFRHKKSISKRGVHDHLSTKKELIQELNENKFRPLKIIGYLHGLEFFYRIKIPVKIVLYLDLLVSKLRIFDKFAYQWLVICEKDET